MAAILIRSRKQRIALGKADKVGVHVHGLQKGARLFRADGPLRCVWWWWAVMVLMVVMAVVIVRMLVTVVMVMMVLVKLV